MTLAWLLYADLTRRSCRAEEQHHRMAFIYEGVLALAPLEELEALNNHPCSGDLAYAGVSLQKFLHKFLHRTLPFPPSRWPVTTAGKLLSHARRPFVQHNLGARDRVSEKTAVVYNRCFR
jgi:hypothetical protein